jgi:hypothetical protein
MTIEDQSKSTFDLRIVIPRRPPGSQSVKVREAYEQQLQAFCDGIEQIRDTLDFDVSSRGWCYLLEEHGLTKGEFSTAQNLINDCRKSGMLPIDICATDERRSAGHVECIDSVGPEDHVESLIDGLSI